MAYWLLEPFIPFKQAHMKIQDRNVTCSLLIDINIITWCIGLDFNHMCVADCSLKHHIKHNIKICPLEILFKIYWL